MADYSADEDGKGDSHYETIKKWYGPDNEKFKLWANGPGGDNEDGGAREDFRFRDGDQWRDSEKETLLLNERPVLVFNRTGVLVDAVVGSEIGNRREVRYIPREQADAKPNEILTSAAEWFRDECDAEDEESEAFKDAVTAGMGWTETRLDFSENPDGEPKIEHFDPMEARWDHNATKANLVDTERRWRVRKMPLSTAKEMFPGHEDEDYDAAWADDLEGSTEATVVEPGNRYSGVNGEDDVSPDKRVTIVGCQYWKRTTYYKVLLLGPDGMPQQVELDADKFKIASDAGAVMKSVKMTKKTVVVCYVGGKVLKAPKPTQTGTWTWNCITGLKDKEKGTFYGIVRRAKDPQRWANKWLSQMMHILNSQAKGGIMAEKDAFENQRDAEDSWAKVERITWMNKGALSGSATTGAKWAAKPVPAFPAGFDRLLQYADDAIVKSTGINMELLGMRDATQPGVLEYQRKQSGIAILATFFDSLRRYRKVQGRGMLHLIQKFLADGRMVRIVGEEQSQYVPLTKEAVTDADYDVIVDDSPTSTNEKEKTWQLLQGILPMFKDRIGPNEMIMLAEYSPLPTSLVEKLKGMSQQAQQQQQNPAQQIGVQIEMKKLELENAKIELEKAKIAAEMRKLQSDENMAQIDMAENAADRELERERLSVQKIDQIGQLISAANPPVQVN